MRSLAALFVMVAVASAAAEVTVKPRLEPARVVVGQPAGLDVVIEGTQSAGMPTIAVPDGVRLEYRGQSTQVSIVNGSMSATLTHSFLLVPDRAGSFDIGPIRVQAGGRDLDAGGVRLEVVGANAAPSPQAAPSAQTAPSTPPQSNDLGPDELRLSLAPAKPRVYLHERVPLRVTLEVGDIQVTDVRYPAVTADGFSVGKFAEPQQHQENRGRRPVQVVDFSTEVVPLKAGDARLSSTMALSVLVRRGNPLFDRFFGMDAAFGGRKNVTLDAEPVTVTVLPLPEANKPASFTGAVGSFSLSATASPVEVRAGDPVTVAVTLRGTGNLEHAGAPALAGSDSLKVYPTSVAGESTRGAALEKRFEQVVIPQAAGDVTLPPLVFSFFDPRDEQYHTVSAAPLALRVLPAPAGQLNVVPPPANAPAQRSEALGRDLVSIKDDPGRLTSPSDRPWRSALFWALQLVPLLAWIGVVQWDRRRQRLSGDERYARFARAGAQARRHLDDAKAALQTGDGPRFYDALARGVHEYLAAKLDLAPGAVAAQTVSERMRAAAVAPALIEDAVALLALCEQVRFAPNAAGDRANALERAEALVRGLERQRRMARSLPVAAAVVLLCCTGAIAWAGSENAKTLFFRGNALYGEEHFPEAAAAYESVRTAGVESAPLYFNLGNAYARSGERGRALVNYERARRMAPADPDVAANLAYVRGDLSDDGVLPLWVRLALPLAGRFATGTLLVLASAAWWILFAALIVARLLPATARAARWTTAVAVVVLVLASSAAVHRLLRIEWPAWAGVLREAAVRFEPSDTGTTHYTAPPGTVVEVVTERNGWAQVARRGDQLRGWVPLDAIERL